VIDPVLRASDGAQLLERRAHGGLVELMRGAALVTPNLPEAETLSGLDVSMQSGAEQAARWFIDEAGAEAALVKGGHRDGAPDDCLARRAGGGVAVAWLAGERQTRRRPTGRIARIHDRTRRFVARRGWAIPPSLPPLEAARWLVAQAGPSATPLEELAWTLYRVRYAGESEDGLVDVASAAASRLSQLPKHRVTT
jgi:hypothetical protein